MLSQTFQIKIHSYILNIEVIYSRYETTIYIFWRKTTIYPYLNSNNLFLKMWMYHITIHNPNIRIRLPSLYLIVCQYTQTLAEGIRGVPKTITNVNICASLMSMSKSKFHSISKQSKSEFLLFYFLKRKSGLWLNIKVLHIN
jgi:hypothetical protein